MNLELVDHSFTSWNRLVTESSGSKVGVSAASTRDWRKQTLQFVETRIELRPSTLLGA